jgi:hypothetical protein
MYWRRSSTSYCRSANEEIDIAALIAVRAGSVAVEKSTPRRIARADDYLVLKISERAHSAR